MATLIYIMVYVGAAIMAYNIVRYFGFMKRISALGEGKQIRGAIAVPFALLIAFLAGYLAVALFGEPDLIIAGILLGGSLFVLIVLGVIYRIVDRLRESNERATTLYDHARSNLDSLTKDYLAVFRVNLTQDTIEEGGGTSVTEEELAAQSFSELLELRQRRLVPDAIENLRNGLFTREALLAHFEAGNANAQEMRLRRMDDGTVSFVKLRASLLSDPKTGDVIAFITEAPCNDEVVTESLLDKALIEQYDMITSLVDGHYRVLIGEDSGKPGSIFPANTEGEYMQYLAEQVAPVIVGSPEEKIVFMSSLGTERVERELATHEPYEVDIACEIDGETFYKRFVYYVVDARAHFYLLLKSDTTNVRREELARSRMLEDALAQARRASKSKSIFLSNMSHDIRTPMNAIVGYTDFALRSDDPAQMHEYLEKIDASSKHLLALINDVLEMSRIESGRIDLEPQPMDLVAIAVEMHDMFATQMAEKDISFTTDATGVRNSAVICDRNRLNRVLLNLLSNAYKFTPEGGTVTLTILQVTDAFGGYADYELRVKDSGIGMGPEFAERVFDAFERERTSTVSGIQGTGLGMAITKRIVDMMGGSIRVETAPGAGTEFIVNLRLELAEPTGAVRVNSQSASPTPTESVDFSGKRILLVEDNEINRDIARIILESMGFALDEATNGQEALDLLAQSEAGRYDAVITDIQMPVMDGYETTRAIRALPDAALARIPVIAMSANAFQEDVQAAHEAGVDAYVPKPVDVEHLTATLAHVLHHAQ